MAQSVRLSQLQATLKDKCAAKWVLILKSCVASSKLAQALEASQHPQILVEASLRKFSGGTLLQYLRAIRLFLTFVHQCVGDLLSLTGQAWVRGTRRKAEGSQGGLKAALGGGPGGGLCGSEGKGLGLGAQASPARHRPANLGRQAIACRTVKGEALEPQLRQSRALPAMRLGKALVQAQSLPAAALVRAGRPKAFRLYCRVDTRSFLPWQGRGAAPRAALQCKAQAGLE